jgi:hypothetical protein
MILTGLLLVSSSLALQIVVTTKDISLLKISISDRLYDVRDRDRKYPLETRSSPIV